MIHHPRFATMQLQDCHTELCFPFILCDELDSFIHACVRAQVVRSELLEAESFPWSASG
jgi:hypothetical protein